MAGEAIQPNQTRLFLAAVAVALAQIIHGFTPADTESDGNFGFFAGSVLLMASLVAVYGVRRHEGWASPLAGWTALVVAAGFVPYHALPFKSPVTNPYLGESVGMLPWLTVFVTIAAGLWCAYEALVVPRRQASLVHDHRGS